MHTQNGFSLIELMVVIAIVAVLASVSVPIYRDYKIKAQINSSLKILKSFTQQAEIYYNKNRVFPSVGTLKFNLGGIVNGANGFSTDAFNTSIIGEVGINTSTNDCAVVSSVGVGPCTWMMIRSSVYGTTGMVGLYMTDVGNDVIKWTCYTRTTAFTVPTKYLPAECIVTN